MIIFLYGENTFLSRQKLKNLKDKFIRDIDPSGQSLSVIDGASSSLLEINEQISPNSLFAKKRMIVIENIFLNKSSEIFEQLINLFKKRKKDDNIIIFWDSSIKTKKQGMKKNVLTLDNKGGEKNILLKPKKFYDFLAKQKYVQEFRDLSNNDLSNWIKKEIENRGGQINLQAINLLISLVGNDLWQINNEIEKLINYKLGQEPKLVSGGKPIIIDIQDIEQLIRGNFDQNIFALTDAISARNKAQTINLLEKEFASGINDVYLLTMITRQFKILLQIRQALDSGFTSRKIISILKLHPFIVQKGINQVRNFNLEQLKNIISQLVEADKDLKTGKIDIRTVLNLLLAQKL